VAAKKPNTPKPSQATLIVQQVSHDSGVELFHSPDGDEYASVVVNGHRETYLIRSKKFRDYLRRLFFQLMHKAPGASAITDAVNMCSAIASDTSSAVHDVFLRVAETEDGALWLDLCDGGWLAVRIDTAGWQVVSNPPVRFRRSPGQMQLPLPESGGSLELLREFLNLASEEDFCLVLSWLCAAFRPHGPFAILALHGEQGTAKSTLSRMLRALLDAYKAPLRTCPRDERDVQIAAANSHLVAIDNISKMEPWLSDALCRLSTGGGMSTRTLYTDNEETIFDSVRPVLINGIGNVGTRGDFADRCIVLYLPQISPEKRQQEEDLWAAFRAVQARILGALLDAIAGGLRNMEAGITLASVPRMADFAKFAVALEQPLGFKPGTFLRAYRENRADATGIVLEDAIAQAVLKFAGQYEDWTGTASDLLKELGPSLPLNEKGFPKSPIAFANALRRLAPSLRTLDVDLQFGKRQAETGRRLIQMSHCTVVAEN
jgi:hypothetical protein